MSSRINRADESNLQQSKGGYTHVVFGKHSANHKWCVAERLFKAEHVWLGIRHSKKNWYFPQIKVNKCLANYWLVKRVAHASYLYLCAYYLANSSTNCYYYLVFAKYHLCVAAFIMWEACNGNCCHPETGSMNWLPWRILLLPRFYKRETRWTKKCFNCDFTSLSQMTHG